MADGGTFVNWVFVLVYVITITGQIGCATLFSCQEVVKKVSLYNLGLNRPFLAGEFTWIILCYKYVVIYAGYL